MNLYAFVEAGDVHFLTEPLDRTNVRLFTVVVSHEHDLDGVLEALFGNRGHVSLLRRHMEDFATDLARIGWQLREQYRPHGHPVPASFWARDPVSEQWIEGSGLILLPESTMEFLSRCLLYGWLSHADAHA